MTFTEVSQRVAELKSRPLISECDTELHDYMWLLDVVSRAVDEAQRNVGCIIGTPDEMFCRIFQVEK